ncbi:steroid hormone receptor ERR1-like [Paramacrobiotus metropolitanus]|uniref:steroid hormone receptor ERR1-like n=1 Tax=Paramacrobiotus metropolitanus TaxID=2943436 RepID=UPI0024464996|nr:steroid hormone receptor ERR1-like [Paramacrobiotus metropolitanus]XP_055333615.1 steroid hormone receptor ERR1-like [Paramacrobiotus metropolitanus]XP_055333616.1 steroid hormone receptor ERR1-like [Paramacrobiotus metropolitanus]
MYKPRHSHSPPRPSTIRVSGHPTTVRHSPSPAEVVHSTSGNLHDHGLDIVDSASSVSVHGQSEESHSDPYGLSGSGSLFHELRSRWEKPTASATVVRYGGGEHLESASGHAVDEVFASPAAGGSNGMQRMTSTGSTSSARDDGNGVASRTRAGTHNKHPAAASWSRSGVQPKLMRGVSDEDMEGPGSSVQGEDEGSNSSLQGSFHGEEAGFSEEVSRKRKCLVCDDSASGYHYGVSSCEACKAFFKRTIQGNIEYACPANNACVIDKRRRKACQACRYKKCLDVGMLKEGVRLDRVRGGRQKYRRAATGDPIIVQIPHASAVRKSTTSHEVNQLIAALVSCEPENIPANITDRLDTPLKIQSVLCDLADRDLVGIIGWAKQIPGFPDLPLNDQMHLLQTTWCEILMFSLCFKSIDAHPRILMFAEDFPVVDQMSREAGFEEVHTRASRLVDGLSEYHVKREEYVLIKCIILLNGGCTLECVQARNALRDTIVQSLHQFVNGTARASSLLLLLPQLRVLDGLAKQFWFMIKNEGKITMHKLFLEMLESAHQLV